MKKISTLFSLMFYFIALSCSSDEVESLIFHPIAPPGIYTDKIISFSSAQWPGPYQILTRDYLCLYHDGFFWPEIDLRKLKIENLYWEAITVDPETGSIYIYDRGRFFEIKRNGEALDRTDALGKIVYKEQHGNEYFPVWLALTSWPGHYSVIAQAGNVDSLYEDNWASFPMDSYYTYVLTEDGFSTYTVPENNLCFEKPHFVEPMPPDGPLIVNGSAWRLTPDGWVKLTQKFYNYDEFPLSGNYRISKVVYNPIDNTYYKSICDYWIDPIPLGKKKIRSGEKTLLGIYYFKYDGTEWILISRGGPAQYFYSEHIHKLMGTRIDAFCGIGDPRYWDGTCWKDYILMKSDPAPQYQGGRFVIAQSNSILQYFTKFYVGHIEPYDLAVYYWDGGKYYWYILWDGTHYDYMIHDFYNAVWDPQRNSIIVFGGLSTFNDYTGVLPTFSFESSTGRWTQLAPSNAGTRYASECAVCYSTLSGGPVAFGGRLPRIDDPTTETVSNEIWLFDSKNVWRKIPMTLEDDLPTSRFVAVIAEDTGTSPPVLVMMGGKNAEQNPIREIWEFDGTNWLNKTAESDMPTTSDVPCSMIYDSRRRCFLCSFPDGSIWSYNRHKWELIKEAGKGINGQLAMDDRSGVLYLFSIEDGLFASIPREAILKHLLGKIPLQGAPLKDADINKNGILDVADLITRIIQLNIQQRK